jgi:hypothetical protein
VSFLAANSTTSVDPIVTSVIQHRLLAIVEMSEAMLRLLLPDPQFQPRLFDRDLRPRRPADRPTGKCRPRRRLPFAARAVTESSSVTTSIRATSFCSTTLITAAATTYPT